MSHSPQAAGVGLEPIHSRADIQYNRMSVSAVLILYTSLYTSLTVPGLIIGRW